MQLQVLVIGCGLAGVTTAIALAKKGHHVTVLEAQKTISELGSGIQLPPNATKILGDLGLAEALRAVATSPHEIDFRSYRDGDLLSKARLIPDMEVLYGAPHLVLHRGDLLALLVREAQLYGVNIVTDCMAARIDFSACTVCTVSGRVFTGDVLIGADGIKSAARDACLAKDTSPQPTGRLVYRLTIPTHKITANPNIRALVEPEKITCWMGPDAHVVCYNLTGKDICSVVLTRLDRNPAPPSTLNPQSAPMEELRAFFTGWDKQLRALLELATSALYWPLLGYQQNDSWTVSNRPFILIGDAAHNMEPHLVQGTSQAIEDAACLAELLDRIEDRSQIAEALNLFQRLRQPRCNEIARRAQEVGRVWTLTDGDAQEERDRQLREQEDCEYSNPFSNEGVREVLYKYDMAKDVSDEWERAMSLKMKAPEH